MIPTPSEAKAKAAEARRNNSSTDGGGNRIPLAQQQEKLMTKVTEALGMKKDGVPMIIATTGFSKDCCNYVREEIEMAGWSVEKGRRDGEFCFIITE